MFSLNGCGTNVFQNTAHTCIRLNPVATTVLATVNSCQVLPLYSTFVAQPACQVLFSIPTGQQQEENQN